MAARATRANSQQAPHRIAARILAPLALVACAVALFAVIGGALSSDGDGDASAGQEQQRQQRNNQQPEVTGETYVVQPGDTLTAVSEKSGVPIPRLERLNPDIDPATLNAGQELRLRR